MKLRNLAAAAATLLLAGCATGYHGAGFTGGYWEHEGPGELIKVHFAGNGFSDASTVDKYLLRRCAEVAQAKGKPYFRMYPSIAEAIIEEKVRKQMVSMVTNGPLGYAYVLLEDQPGKDTISTADTLAATAHLVDDKKGKK